WLASLARYLSSLRWCLLSCSNPAALAAAALVAVNRSAANRARISFPMASSSTNSLKLSKVPGELDSRSEEHTSELQSLAYLVCRLLLEKKRKKKKITIEQTVTTPQYMYPCILTSIIAY